METINNGVIGIMAIAAIVAFCASFIKNLDFIRSKSNEPFEKIVKKIDDNNTKMNSRLDVMQCDLNFVIKAVSVLCEHEATGNDINSMKKLHKEINDYLIDTRRG